MLSAFVAVIGRPSAGKSTLVNTLCGHKVSIVSPIPQTTRNAIRGMFNEKRGQLVFVDTPGYHNSERKFNKKLTNVVKSSLDDADVVLYLVDMSRPIGDEERFLIKLISQAKRPVIVALNKSDLVNTGVTVASSPAHGAGAPKIAKADPETAADAASAGTATAPSKRTAERPAAGKKQQEQNKPAAPEDEDSYVDEYAESNAGTGSHNVALPPAELKKLFAQAFPQSKILEISATNGYGVKELKTALFEAAPEGKAWYPEEYYTDQDPSFRVAEIIREQVMNRTRDEIPHAAYVELKTLELRSAAGELLQTGHDSSGDWDLPVSKRPKMKIRAAICVERDSQKGIVVGKAGSLIKAIREESEKQMREVFPWYVELELQVRVAPKWRSDDKLIGRIIH